MKYIEKPELTKFISIKKFCPKRTHKIPKISDIKQSFTINGKQKSFILIKPYNLENYSLCQFEFTLKTYKLHLFYGTASSIKATLPGAWVYAIFNNGIKIEDGISNFIDTELSSSNKDFRTKIFNVLGYLGYKCFTKEL